MAEEALVKSELEALLAKHTAEAEAKGRQAGIQDALRALREVLGSTWVDSVEVAYGFEMHARVHVKTRSSKRRYVPIGRESGKYDECAHLDREYLEGPANEVIPKAVEEALGLV